MSRSAKYRNIGVNPRVAFVVDEVTEESMAGAHLAPEIIRIHPRRVIAFNVDPGQPGLQARDLPATGARPGSA